MQIDYLPVLIAVLVFTGVVLSLSAKPGRNASGPAGVILVGILIFAAAMTTHLWLPLILEVK